MIVAGDEELLLNGFEAKNKEQCVADADRATRIVFIRKVCLALVVQFLLVITVAVSCVLYPGCPLLIRNWTWMLTDGAIFSTLCLVFLHLYRFKWPANGLLLFCWTVCQCFLIGCIVSFIDDLCIVQAYLVLTCAMIGHMLLTVLPLYALNTRASCLFAVVVALSIGCVTELYLRLQSVEMVIAAAFISAFIVYDLNQLMLRLTREQFIVAIICIYTDLFALPLIPLRLLQQWFCVVNAD